MRPGGLETSRAKIKRDTCLNIYIYYMCVRVKITCSSCIRFELVGPLSFSMSVVSLGACGLPYRSSCRGSIPEQISKNTYKHPHTHHDMSPARVCIV